MHPILAELPAVLILSVAGLMLGTLLAAWLGKGKLPAWLGAFLGVGCALLLGWAKGWLAERAPLRGYGVMILLGFLLGVWLARRRSGLLGVEKDHCTDLGIWGLLGGIAGARLFFVVQNWNEFSPDLHGWEGFKRSFALWEGGLVFYGAFVGAILVAWGYCRLHKIPLVPFLDLAAPCLIAGLALGRLGCFLNGCCYGKPCGSAWGVSFPPGNEQLRASFYPDPASPSLRLHPVQLYAFLGAALVAAFLYAYWPRRRYDGQVFGLMFLMAGATRFLEEFLRGDTAAAFPAVSESLSIAQWFGLGLVLSGALWLYYFRKRNLLFEPEALEAG